MRRPKNPIASFHHALDGVLHSYRTQRHLRFHFLLAAGVLAAGIVLRLPRTELLVLLFAIALVVVAELMNTAVETVVDLVTTSYHPLAKLAKDVAAGAVLVAALNAVIVGVLIFIDLKQLQDLAANNIPRPSNVQTSVVAFALLMIFLVAWKVMGAQGRFLHGGVVSGHAAIAFCMCTVILVLTESPFVAFLAILLALLVAQSRVEARIHSIREVLLGALLGILVPVLLFRVVPTVVQQVATAIRQAR